MEQKIFNQYVEQCLPRLRNVVRKQIGHPDQTDDIVQETLVKAWEKRASFKGNSTFCTWLCSIAIRNGLDFLRSQKQWREKSQVIYAWHCMNIPQWGVEVGQSMANPAIHYEADEHIAYCFSCVGRSLPPIEQAALILKEVLNLTGIEAGKVLGVTESVFRQHLTRARQTMQQKYASLCALVNKQGVCYQCKGLREGFTENRQGQWPLSTGLDFELRMKLVRNADIDQGKTQPMHEIFWRRTQQQEEQDMGDESATTDCGH